MKNLATTVLRVLNAIHNHLEVWGTAAAQAKRM